MLKYLKNKKILAVIFCTLLMIKLFTLSGNTKPLQLNNYNNFIAVPSVWKYFLNEEIPKPIPKKGKILCIEKISKHSRLINGSLILKPSMHEILGQTNAFKANIIGCNSNEMPLFYLTDGTEQIKNNPDVKTFYYNSKLKNSNNSTIQNNRLKSSCIKKSKNPMCTLKIELSKGNITQVLVEKNIIDTYNTQGNTTIIWAGDLDDDKKLDLLIRYINYQNEIALSLFLSSYAKNTQLVKEVKKIIYSVD
jgi:hypothetical protein